MVFQFKKPNNVAQKQGRRRGGTIAEYTVLEILQNDMIFLGIISGKVFIFRTIKQILCYATSKKTRHLIKL